MLSGALGLAASGIAMASAPRLAHAAEEIDDALAEVARARASLKTLTGPFTQERTIGLLASKIRSTGTLTLVRPDRLRWELAPPDDVVYWVGPEGLAFKSARSRGRVALGGPNGTTGAKLAAALDDIRILLGGDLSKLRERYDLHLVSRTPEGIAFEGTPRPGTGTKLDKLAFALDKDRVRPTRATLVEGPRDKTEIVFGTLERDVAIDPAKMRAPF
jgi:outer membrane lipoprotein-sorting protein